MNKQTLKKRWDELSEEEQKQAELLLESDMWESYEEEDRIVKVLEALELEKKNKKGFTIKTGFTELDECIGGFHEGQLIILSGATGQGKTTFAKTLTKRLYKQNISCLWFSYEVTVEQLVTGFGNSANFYVPRKIKHGGVGWIEDRIKEGIAKHDIKVIFIDHLHYLVKMSDMAQAKSLSLLIGDRLRRLKEFAIAYGVTIVLISHMTKLKYDKEPDVEDLRDSSFVGQEADVVLFVRRQKETSHGIIKVAKNRMFGRLQSFMLTHKNGMFTEYDPNYDANDPQNYETTNTTTTKEDDIKPEFIFGD